MIVLYSLLIIIYMAVAIGFFTFILTGYANDKTVPWPPQRRKRAIWWTLAIGVFGSVSLVWPISFVVGMAYAAAKDFSND